MATHFALADAPAGPWITHPDRACVKPGVNPEDFFPPPGSSTASRRAIVTCHPCIVRQECRAYALATPWLFGVWGGLGEHDRKKIHRARKNT